MNESHPELQLVSTFPTGTSLDDYDIPRAHRVWIEMIESAESTLDIGQFYIISEPRRRMEPVLKAIDDAAERGVAVRVIVDAKFVQDYGDAVRQLEQNANIKVSAIDFGKISGGILHAKYFIVDRKDAFIGSQNFDWRSLEHIVELGVRIRNKELVESISDVFDTDWGLANGEPADFRVGKSTKQFPAIIEYDGEPVSCTPAFSHHDFLPNETLWDLPSILTAINTAKRSVIIQVMSYATHEKDGTEWKLLDQALRNAATRGAKVTLLVGDWSKRNRRKMQALRSLHQVPNVRVRIVSIPEAPEGPIEFARVIHSKFMVVDGIKSWIGTSNWSKGYFLNSRNLGLRVDGTSFAQQLERLFKHVAYSDYANDVIPDELPAVLKRIEDCTEKGRLPVVVFDLDSTVFSTGPRNLTILKEFAKEAAIKKADEYAPFLELVKAIHPDQIPWNATELFRSLEWADKKFLKMWKEFWSSRFFKNEYVARDEPTEGAVEFVNACHNRGALIYYLTGRHYGNIKDGMDFGTCEALIRSGLPISNGHTIMHLKPNFEMDDEDFKNEAIPKLRQLRGEVIATFENEPANANLFLQEFPEAINFWLQTVWSPKDVFPDSRLVKVDNFVCR